MTEPVRTFMDSLADCMRYQMPCDNWFQFFLDSQVIKRAAGATESLAGDVDLTYGDSPTKFMSLKEDVFYK